MKEMSKTPEEIKKGLMCGSVFCNIECPYWNDDSCTIKVNEDALSYIQRLESQNAELLEKIKQLERERDAAVADLGKARGCKTCKHITLPPEARPCRSCGICGKNYEWRGPCEENTENA